MYSNGPLKRDVAVFTWTFVPPVFIAGKFLIFSSESALVVADLYVAMRRKVRPKKREMIKVSYRESLKNASYCTK